MPEDFTYPKGSLSSHMAKMLKTQSAMIELHKQRIQKSDEKHTKLPSAPDYTVFENGSFVLLDPASGTAKNRLHSCRTGPFLVLDHVDNTYYLKSLVSKKDFKANIHMLHPFNFDPNKVNPQEVADHDDE